MGLLPMDEDILPASDDRVFKLILTSPEATPILIDLISSIINRQVISVTVRNNEHIIYVELSKLNKILKKSVNDMTDLEKWSIFFQYANEPKYRETINKVIESKEVLKMAGNLLMSISKDERERAIFRSRRMYQSDLESNLATAEARGKAEGETTKALAIARSMIADGEPIDKIIRYTKLSQKEIENLRK
jgi:predicted transposase/invertase (TIGR01784 family)